MTGKTDEQQRRVARVVSQVILETSGRCVEPAAQEALFEKGFLESVDLVHLVLALQTEFDIVLDAAETNPRTMGSITAITGLVASRATE